MPRRETPPPFAVFGELEHPVAGGDFKTNAPGADVEFRAGVVAIDEAIAVADIDVVFGDVALMFLVTSQQIGDVGFILDQEDFREVPDGGGGGGEAAVFAVLAINR